MTVIVPAELFHGTSSVNAISILEGGTVEGYEDRGEGTDQGISTTSIYSIAEQFGAAMASGDDGYSVPVVLVIDGRRLLHDGYKIVPWVNASGRSANESEWRILGSSVPTSYITDVYVNGRYMDIKDGLTALRKIKRPRRRR